jgi:hypothetical protein
VFADPQSVTYSGAAKSLPKIGGNQDQSSFRMNDSGVTYELTIGHSFKARTRVFARLRRDSYVADPLVPANSIGASMTATLTIDFPNTGVMPSDALALGNALVAWATSARLTQLTGGEI